MVTPTGTDSRNQNMNEKMAFGLVSAAAAITATPGGTQVTSLVLAAQINQVSVVATGADGVRLPAAIVGMQIVIINDGANALQVFGHLTATIDGITSATGVALSAAKRATFHCYAAGKWASQLGAVST